MEKITLTTEQKEAVKALLYLAAFSILNSKRNNKLPPGPIESGEFSQIMYSPEKDLVEDVKYEVSITCNHTTIGYYTLSYWHFEWQTMKNLFKSYNQEKQNSSSEETIEFFCKLLDDKSIEIRCMGLVLIYKEEFDFTEC